MGKRQGVRLAAPAAASATRACARPIKLELVSLDDYCERVELFLRSVTRERLKKSCRARNLRGVDFVRAGCERLCGCPRSRAQQST
jgi:hypothetical protein